MGSKIYLQTLLITLSSMRRCQQPITCDAGRFKAGQTASVTCNFPRNLEDIGHHVYVEHYPLDAPDDSSGNDIVRCFRSYDHELICDVAKGVKMNSDITDRLTFHIPEVTTDFAGRYMCQLVPPDDTFMVSCILTVEGTLSQNKTDKENVAESDDIRLKFAAITILCVCGILLCGVTCFCWFRIRRRRLSRNSSAQYDAVKRESPDVHALANSSFGRAVSNEYTLMDLIDILNTNHQQTVSAQRDSPVCQDMSFEPIKPSHGSTCRTCSCLYSALKSHNNQIDIPPSKLMSTVRSYSPSSVSYTRDDDSSNSSIYASMHDDNSHNGNETDGFYSSWQTQVR